MPTCLGEERGEAFAIQHKHCVFSVCNNLLGLVCNPSLLPLLLNHVTASAIRLYISVKLFPVIVGIRLIFFFLVRFVLCSNRHSSSLSSRLSRHGIRVLLHLNNL